MSDSMERSEEEREAARIERERQRAERAGSGPVASQEEPEEQALVQDGDGTEDWEQLEDREELDDPEELEDGKDPSLDYDEDDELPAGTKRISRLQRQRIAESSGRPARPRSRQSRGAPPTAGTPGASGCCP